MSDETNLAREPSRDMTAAEYALGTLDSVGRESATRLRASDSAFDASVRWWERRLSGLTAGIAPVAPSESLWSRIAAGLETPSALTGRDDNVIVLRRTVARWRIATLAAGALAAALALFVLDRAILHAPNPSAGAYFAAVNRGGDMPALIVRVDLATKAVTIRPIEMDAPAGKSMELWYIAAGQAPKSMGLVGKDRAQMPMPASTDMKGGVFAVSLEPPGGSPTGAPTGPVVYKGMLIPE